MVYRYPPEVHEFVKTNATKMRDSMLAEECNKTLGTNFTASTMKAFRGNHGYRNGKKQWTKEEYWKYQRRYPEGMYEFIRDNSWGVSSREMAEMVNEKFGTDFSQTMMKQFRQRHGIKSGVTGWYRKGNPPLPLLGNPRPDPAGRSFCSSFRPSYRRRHRSRQNR